MGIRAFTVSRTSDEPNEGGVRPSFVVLTTDPDPHAYIENIGGLTDVVEVGLEDVVDSQFDGAALLTSVEL